MQTEMKELLEGVKNGTVTVDEALLQLKKEPFEELGYANIDMHRGLRQGLAEVIYGAGKTSGQICGIVDAMLKKGQSRILITRLDEEKAGAVAASFDLTYKKDAGIGYIGLPPEPNGIGTIVVATGGTSDIPVAEEAALTAEFYGNRVLRLYDVGVSGVHRLFSRLDDIMTASVIIAIAGMEGALASVIGGLADCPVIAVPTSVGYGASFNGLSALLSMLNSCASGVTVVNIDNGFGAGYFASMVNHMESKT